MNLNHALGHQQQPAPALPDPVLAAIEQELQEGDSFVLSRYPRIVKALTKKAEQGDKTAAELLLKHVVNAKREQIETRKAEQPGPVPLSIRIAQAKIQYNIYGDKPTVELTASEHAALLPDQRKELTGMNVHIVEPFALLTDSSLPVIPSGTGGAVDTNNDLPLVSTVSPTLPSEPKANKECTECGQPYYSAQPAARYCPACRKQRNTLKLAQHRKRHGQHLSPRMREALGEIPAGETGPLVSENSLVAQPRGTDAR